MIDQYLAPMLGFMCVLCFITSAVLYYVHKDNKMLRADFDNNYKDMREEFEARCSANYDNYRKRIIKRNIVRVGNKHASYIGIEDIDNVIACFQKAGINTDDILFLPFHVNIDDCWKVDVVAQEIKHET